MTATMAMITGRSAGQAAKRIGAARMSRKRARNLKRKPVSSQDDVVDLGRCRLRSAFSTGGAIGEQRNYSVRSSCIL